MIDIIDKVIQDGVDRGLLQKSISDDSLSSSAISIDGQQLVNFGSCSYMGLEFNDRIKAAVKKTVDRFGTQFSTSRTYLSIGLYKALESELTIMFGKHTIATASTTLGHLAALPVLIEKNDVVILDLQVHSSVQMSAQMLKANKIPIHIIPHNDMEALEAKIKTLHSVEGKIWYLADGVYSMYGDLAPLNKLEKLLDKYDKLHLYIDDAHGMGWTGDKGVGYVRSQIDHHDKMILVTSLNKSFAASGGVIVFPDESSWRKVKNCGTTLIFSGPIQPPMLGAAIASAELHQTIAFKRMQELFQYKIEYTNTRLKELDLPQYQESDSPLFFIPVGLPRVTRNIIKRMKKVGFYVNGAAFPAVPMKKGGIRFMINNNLSIEEIESMLVNLQKEYVLGLYDEGSSIEEVAKLFKLKPFLLEHNFDVKRESNPANLKEEFHDSIKTISSQEWNLMFSKFGSNEYQNLLDLEQVFRDNSEVENNWDIQYHIVRDRNNKVVLASVYSIALMMDNMLNDREISSKIKDKRKDDKYYLTSYTLISGTPFTKGKSVYINYGHDDWKEAVKLHVSMLQDLAESKEVSKMILRDFCSNYKDKLQNYLLELGLIDIQLPNNCVMRDMSWENEEVLAKNLPQKYRYSLRKEILRREGLFLVDYDRPDSEEKKKHVFELYQQVYNRSTVISVFELPFSLFERMFTSESYDFINLYLLDGSDKPVGVMISQIIDGAYNAQLVGLDYDYVTDKGTYKQILYQTVKRAKQLNCTMVDMAYTAEMEKKKVGANPERTYGFVMALNHDSHAEIELLN